VTFGDLVIGIGHVRQARECVAEISERIKSLSAAVFDERVDDGAALAGIGIANGEPVFLSKLFRNVPLLTQEKSKRHA